MELTGVLGNPFFIYKVLHTNHHPDTAILLFSRSAIEESRIKSLDPGQGMERNRAIIRSLIRHSYTAARKTGLPVFTCFSSQQVGQDFGERLTNAIDAIFAQGFDQVITIGNDCPSITPALLLDARNRLRTQDMVLGPATDGGVYLIGVDRKAWNPRKFQALAWQSEQLQSAFKAYGCSITWLNEFQDLDHAEDLHQFLQDAPRQNLLRQEISEILGHTAVHNSYSHTLLSPAVLHRTPSLRAPPH